VTSAHLLGQKAPTSPPPIEFDFQVDGLLQFLSQLWSVMVVTVVTVVY